MAVQPPKPVKSAAVSRITGTGVCPRCGTPNEPDANFCENCCEALKTGPAPVQRRTVARLNLPIATGKRRVVLLGALLALTLAAGGVLVFYLYDSLHHAAHLTSGAPVRHESASEKRSSLVPSPSPAAATSESAPPASPPMQQSPSSALLDPVAPKPATGYSLYGYIRDSNGAGIQGVTISFNGSKHARSNSDGFWTQKDLTGTVIVKAAKPGWVFTPASLKADEKSVQLSFTGTSDVTAVSTAPSNQAAPIVQADYRIGGRIVDQNGRVLSGVRLGLSGGQEAVTDSRGNWSKDGLNGRVTVTPRCLGMVFDPPSADIDHGIDSLDFRGTRVEMCENNANIWCFITNRSGSVVLVGDPAQRKLGGSSIRVWTKITDPMMLQFPRTRDAGWDLSGVKEIVVWFRAENSGVFANGFKDSPWIKLCTSSGHILLNPAMSFLDDSIDKWICLTVPLMGGPEWNRSEKGNIALSRIDWLEIGFSPRRSGVVLWIDGLIFK